jgi:hypothetical protein
VPSTTSSSSCRRWTCRAWASLAVVAGALSRPTVSTWLSQRLHFFCMRTPYFHVCVRARVRRIASVRPCVRACVPYALTSASLCACARARARAVSAMDDRIGPAAIACYMSTFDTDFAYDGAADGEQIYLSGIAAGLDKPDFLEVRAPKPTLAMVTTNDDCFPLQGGRDAVSEAAAAFEAYGAADNLSYTEAVFGHGWVRPNNENMYGFFLRHFNLPGDQAELPLELFTCQQLMVTATGQIGTDPAYADAVFAPDLVMAAAEVNQARLAELRKPENTDAFLASLPKTAAATSGLLVPTEASLGGRFIGSYFYNSTSPPSSVASTRVPRRPSRVPWSSGAARALNTAPVAGDVEKWALDGESGCSIAIQLYKPTQQRSAPRTIVVLGSFDPYGVPDPLEAALIATAATNGSMHVALVDVCGLGEVSALCIRGVVVASLVLVGCCC